MKNLFKNLEKPDTSGLLLCEFNVVVLVMAVFLISFAGNSLGEGGEKAAKLETIVVTSSSGGWGRTDWDFGMEKGFFQKEGISLEFIAAKGLIRLAALKVGNVNYSLEGTSGVWDAAAGLPTKLTFFSSPRRPNFLVTKSDIKDPRALKGKVIGVSTLGDTEHMAVEDIGKQFGLAPGDITVMSLGPDEMLRFQSLVTGSIDGMVISCPINFLAEDRGFKRLLNIYDYFPTFSLGLVTRDEIIKKNRGEVKRMVRGTLRSHLYVLGNKEEVVEFLVRKAAIQRSMAARAYDVYRANWSPNGLVEETAIQYQLDVGRRLGRPIPKTVTPSQVIDLSILKEVQKELGL